VSHSFTVALGLATCVFLLACGSDAPSPPDCVEVECVRPYICVESCGGPVLSSGCCECPEGQIDRMVDCSDEVLRVPEG